MPQFDISSFPVQILWLFFLLLVLYVFLRHQFLPGVLFLIKIRAKLSTQSTSTSYKPIQIKEANQYNTYRY